MIEERDSAPEVVETARGPAEFARGEHLVRPVGAHSIRLSAGSAQ